MADYADWTESIELLGSEIMVPFDVQGAYIQVPMDLQGALIQMPVDIQGQYITLDINIESVAADVTLNVNITASAVTINMDIVAQSVGVYLQPEWAAKQGQDKNFAGYTENTVRFGTASVEYTVPSGKTLYMYAITGASNAYVDSNSELNQMCMVQIQVNATPMASIGGNGGAGMNFSKPYKLAAGQVLTLICENMSNHTCDLRIAANGYEL